MSGDTSRRRRPREPREPEAGRRRRRRCSGAPRSGAHRRPPGAHQQALHTRAQRSRLPAASALAPCVCLCTSASLQNASCSISRTTGTSQWAYATRVAGRLVVKWRLPRRFKNPSPDTLRAGGPEHASRMSNPPTSPVGRWLRCVCAHVCGPPALAGGPASGMSNEHGVVPCSI